MSLKATFFTGSDTTVVRGLYQWDYGQSLEIECAEVGTDVLEVHFACANMSEAIVRACYFESGIGTVEIPDECLEQTSVVTAWICKSDATQRHTIKTITLPLTSRTRPAPVRDIPEKYVDSYGQLLSEVGDAVGKLSRGEITAARALNADNANHAASATTADNATNANTAGNASNAQIAQLANAATSVTTLLHATVNLNSDGTGVAPSLSANTIYIVVHYNEGFYSSGVFVSLGGGIQYGTVATTLLTIYNETITLGNAKGGTLKFYKLGGLS